MTKETDDLEQRIDELEKTVSRLRHGRRHHSLRLQSKTKILGLPLYDIANGPDFERGELRGHARGIIAIGDVATGVLAIGGLARGLLAVGGLAFGGVTLGGCSFGLLFAMGGVAVGGIAFGGCAIGLVAIGGCAIGVVAIGATAVGKYVVNAQQQDPEIIRVLGQWTPGLDRFRK